MAGSFWATISVQINFSGSTWTDVTAYVQAIEAKRGRQYELDEPRAGTLKIQLENRDGRFDPTNASSPYFPNVLLYKGIRIICTNGSFTNTIWFGYVERWPQAYRDAGNWQVSALGAVDIFGALKQKTFLPLAEEMINQQGPVNNWWPMTSAMGTFTPEKTLGVQNGQIATFGGNQQVTFGNSPYPNPAPGLEGSGGANFTPTNPGYGYPSSMSVVKMEIPRDGTYFAFPTAPWTLCLTIQTKTRPALATNYNAMSFLAFLDSGGNNATHTFSEQLFFLVTPRGNLQVVVVDQDNAILNLEFNAQIADGNPHFLSIELSTPTAGQPSWQRPDGLVPTMYASIDNQGIAVINSGNTSFGWRWDQLTNMAIGGLWAANQNASNSFQGTISEVCWFSGNLITSGAFSGGSSTNLPNAMINGWSGQKTDARIQSLMTLAGYGSKFTSLGTGNTTFQEAQIGGSDAATLIINAAKWEGGLVFSRGDGQLVFSPRSGRLNKASSLTIGDGTNYPVGGLALSYDTSQLATQAQVGRTNGNTFVVNNTTAQAQFGVWSKQITGEGVLTDNHCFAQAQFISQRYGAPTTRIEQVVLDAGSNQNIMSLVTGAAGLSALELNQMLTIQHTPLGGNAVNMKVWVESLSYTITPTSFTIGMDLSPADTTTYLTTDLAGSSVLNNSSNVLGF
ncbi:hypothetical protein ACFVUS_12500 [Nocardia sp. NPDC058058]|uniref:hypothetical protein n=1 Tax=Nocardia sp. NPDC058058 TaxID=3346317 RepID=UPI0036DECCBB